MIYPDNPVRDTWIFVSIFVFFILLGMRRRKDKQLFPVSVTQELKGFAILFIIFAHIGYYISGNPHLLWPLSNIAGVGVNIFLFVSGYGLSVSSLKRPLGIWQFYWKRLRKLYIPFWIVISFYFVLNYLFLHNQYTLEYFIKAFLGIFETAGSNDLNSPLWYFTLIAFYYLVYPLVFWRRQLWVSALLIFAIGIYLMDYTSIGQIYNSGLYKVYNVAFPLGMLAAWLHYQKSHWFAWFSKPIKQLKDQVKHPLLRNELVHFIALVAIAILFYKIRLHTSPDQTPHREQLFNVISMLVVVLFFMIKRVNLKLFYIFGLYSYEIYLVHWPLMYRYNFIFGHVPAWLAIILYLLIFLALGWLLQNLPALTSKYIHPRKIFSRAN